MTPLPGLKQLRVPPQSQSQQTLMGQRTLVVTGRLGEHDKIALEALLLEIPEGDGICDAAVEVVMAVDVYNA